MEKKLGQSGISLTQGMYTTVQLFGWMYIIKRIIRAAWNYRKDFFYLLTRKSIRSAYSFFYTKVFVPCGEGAGAAWYILLGGKLIKKYPQLAPFPHYIEIEHTTICDKKCIMCEHTYWKDQEERHLSFGEFKHIIDQFPNLRWAHLTGEGSSFLNKNFLRMIQYIKKSKQACVYLVDLFDGINDNEIEELVSLSVEGVYISMDAATKDTYRKIRVGCDFDRVIEKIKKILALKKKLKTPFPELSFRFIILKPNLHEIPLFIDLVASFGKRELLGSDSRVNFVGNLEFPEVKHLSVYEIPEAIINAALYKARKYNLNVIFSHTEPKTNPTLNECYAWLEPYIMMPGYVLPCCNVMMSNRRIFLRQHSFGNLFKSSFRDIWHSDRYKRFRATINKKEAKVPLFCVGCRSFDSSERINKFGVDKEL
jgi:MoaA/NifB/PqqE/SkfB family radical SAM enzyme